MAHIITGTFLLATCIHEWWDIACLWDGYVADIRARSLDRKHVSVIDQQAARRQGRVHSLALLGAAPMLEHMDRMVAQIILKLKPVGCWRWWVVGAASIAAAR